MVKLGIYIVIDFLKNCDRLDNAMSIECGKCIFGMSSGVSRFKIVFATHYEFIELI
jgi:hypothetical protein